MSSRNTLVVFIKILWIFLNGSRKSHWNKIAGKKISVIQQRTVFK